MYKMFLRLLVNGTQHARAFILYIYNSYLFTLILNRVINKSFYWLERDNIGEQARKK